MILPTQKFFLCIKKATQSSPNTTVLFFLLNSSYNILTKFLKKRIAGATDQFVSDTQFGFRRGKSTSEPLFCLRRLQDLAEAGYQNIILIFLDWEKAFDRISHQRLFEALKRMKIDAKMINIKALYEHPFFKTIHNTEESKWKKNGILAYGRDVRYRFCLFNLIISVLFFDVRRRTTMRFSRKLSIT